MESSHVVPVDCGVTGRKLVGEQAFESVIVLWDPFRRKSDAAGRPEI